jgi:hypothetical protein
MVAGGEHCQLRAAIEVLVPYSSGRSHVVLARFARNRRLADALDQWAFCSLKASPGARRYYDELQARGKTHHQAVHQLTNRWVGILHTCLQRDEIYDEEIAWQSEKPVAA